MTNTPCPTTLGTVYHIHEAVRLADASPVEVIAADKNMRHSSRYGTNMVDAAMRRIPDTKKRFADITKAACQLQTGGLPRPCSATSEISNLALMPQAYPRSAACAAANRAVGTRKGEQLT